MAGNIDRVDERRGLSSDARRLISAGVLSFFLHTGVVLIPSGVANAPQIVAPWAPEIKVAQLTVSILRPNAGEVSAISPEPLAPESSGSLLLQGTYVLSDENRSGTPEPPAEPKALLVPLTDLDYRRPHELSRRPEALAAVALETQEIRFRKETGSLILLLKISRDGMVDSADIERSELPPLYGQTARSAFAQIRFRPGEVDGRRVRSIMRVEITYVPLLVPVVTDADRAASDAGPPAQP
ncbi:MAG: energy transducer TonB [Rhodocyclaceae bacterium]|nr:energy transducer TonB [Rhodocyclaceae bacterium]